MCNLTFSAQANSPFYSHAKDVIIIRKILKSSSLVTQRKKHVTLTLILRNRIYLVTIDHYGGSAFFLFTLCDRSFRGPTSEAFILFLA